MEDLNSTLNKPDFDASSFSESLLSEASTTSKQGKQLKKKKTTTTTNIPCLTIFGRRAVTAQYQGAKKENFGSFATRVCDMQKKCATTSTRFNGAYYTNLNPVTYFVVQLSVGVLVHVTCMHCEMCGVSFSTPLSGDASPPESVIRLGRVLCCNCDDVFFPPCAKCSRYDPFLSF